VSDRDPRLDRIRETGYTTGEAKSLIAGLVGWDAAEIRGFVILAIDHQGRAGLGGSPNITPAQIPALFQRAARAYAADLAKDE
jgi:hypothetical protein